MRSSPSVAFLVSSYMTCGACGPSTPPPGDAAVEQAARGSASVAAAAPATPAALPTATISSVDASSAEQALQQAIADEARSGRLGGDKLEEIRQLMKSAERGYQKACDAGLGEGCFRFGLHRRERDRANGLYEGGKYDFARSCELDHWDGCLQHAQDETFHRPDYAKTVLTRACEAGHASSCTELGRLYFESDGQPRPPADYERAFGLFKKACNGGSYAGCLSLGLCYQAGKGVKADEVEAKRFLHRACQLDKDGCYRSCMGGNKADC